MPMPMPIRMLKLCHCCRKHGRRLPQNPGGRGGQTLVVSEKDSWCLEENPDNCTSFGRCPALGTRDFSTFGASIEPLRPRKTVVYQGLPVATVMPLQPPRFCSQPRLDNRCYRQPHPLPHLVGVATPARDSPLAHRTFEQLQKSLQ